MAETISQRVNALFLSFVTMNQDVYRLGDEGKNSEADARSTETLHCGMQILALRDRSADPDHIAAHILVELMTVHQWPPKPGIDWGYEHQTFLLPLLAIVADKTTGAVREQANIALASFIDREDLDL